MKLLLENWKKFLNEGKEDFEPHIMYDPKTGEEEKAKTYKRHLELKKKGWAHEKPQLDETKNEDGKEQGVDGKACWKGYRHAGTEDGKDKCVKKETIEEFYEVDALDENEEYCPVCVEAQLEEKEKKACKPSKGKRFAKRVDGKCRSFGQSGQAKGGGDRIRPGTAKGDAYCARSAKIKKCKNPPCANTLSRKKWKCKGSKSVA